MPEELIALAYDAFARRDLARLGTLLAADVQFIVPPAGRGITAERDGRRALLEEMSRTVNVTNGTAAATLEATYACADGRRVCVQHETAHFRTVHVDRRALLLVTVAHERITRIEWLRLLRSGVQTEDDRLRKTT